MKRLLFAVLSAFIVSFSLSAQNHMTFKGKAIDGPQKEFETFLVASGFKPDHMDHWFEGTFAGISDCFVFTVTMRKNTNIWKVVVITPDYTNWRDLKGKYQSLKKSYTDKYGMPLVIESFSSPYEEGDGYELSALSSGKCEYVSMFSIPEGYIMLKLSSSSYGKGYISISYEDKINGEKFSEEREAVINDDI